MHKKLTITVDEKVYRGLKRKIGPRRISQFIEELIRPHVIPEDLTQAYADMAKEELREKEALEYTEGVIEDFER